MDRRTPNIHYDGRETTNTKHRTQKKEKEIKLTDLEDREDRAACEGLGLDETATSHGKTKAEGAFTRPRPFLRTAKKENTVV